MLVSGKLKGLLRRCCKGGQLLRAGYQMFALSPLLPQERPLSAPWSIPHGCAVLAPSRSAVAFVPFHRQAAVSLVTAKPPWWARARTLLSRHASAYVCPRWSIPHGCAVPAYPWPAVAFVPLRMQPAVSLVTAKLPWWAHPRTLLGQHASAYTCHHGHWSRFLRAVPARSWGARSTPSFPSRCMALLSGAFVVTALWQ